MPGPPTSPRSTALLSLSEQLLLWALRQSALGPAGHAELQQGLWLACGLCGVEQALDALEGLQAALRDGARRPRPMAAVRAPRVEAREEALLALVAALQAGHGAHAGALALWLVRPAARARLLRHARALAAALAHRQPPLPLPAPARPSAPRAGRPSAVPAASR